MNSQMHGRVALSYPAEQRCGVRLLNQRVDQSVAINTEQSKIATAVVGVAPVQVNVMNRGAALGMVSLADFAVPFELVPQCDSVKPIGNLDGSATLLMAGAFARMLVFTAIRGLAMLFSMFKAHDSRRCLNWVVAPAAHACSRALVILLSCFGSKLVKARAAIRMARDKIISAGSAFSALHSQHLVNGRIGQAELSGHTASVTKPGVSLSYGFLVGAIAGWHGSQFTWRCWS